MIEVSVAVGVDTHEVTTWIVEWEEVDFVKQVSGEQDIVLVVDPADTRSLNVTHHAGVRARRGREHEDAAHPRRQLGDIPASLLSFQLTRVAVSASNIANVSRFFIRSAVPA